MGALFQPDDSPPHPFRYTVAPGRRITRDGKELVRISMTDGFGRYLSPDMTPNKADALAERIAHLLSQHGEI